MFVLGWGLVKWIAFGGRRSWELAAGPTLSLSVSVSVSVQEGDEAVRLLGSKAAADCRKRSGFFIESCWAHFSSRKGDCPKGVEGHGGCW